MLSGPSHFQVGGNKIKISTCLTDKRPTCRIEAVSLKCRNRILRPQNFLYHGQQMWRIVDWQLALSGQTFVTVLGLILKTSAISERFSNQVKRFHNKFSVKISSRAPFCGIQFSGSEGIILQSYSWFWTKTTRRKGIFAATSYAAKSKICFPTMCPASTYLLRIYNSELFNFHRQSTQIVAEIRCKIFRRLLGECFRKCHILKLL